MKLLDKFDDFLTDTVDLNATRIALLEDSIEAIKKAITGSDWKPKIIEFKAHGSWAHKTIIRPLPDYPFDADLLVYVEPVDGWEAKEYLQQLYAKLNDISTYKDKLRRFSHCVTVEYAGDRKIDIAPCIKGRQYSNVYEVCNRVSNTFEVSAPGDYTQWLLKRNAITTSNRFRKVTRLLKFLRDIKTNFTCPSFLLTPLLGQNVYDGDEGAGAFPDVPTTLKVIMGRLDDWLQANPYLPTVRNPVLYSEIQSSCWDQTKYANFRTKINTYRQWIDDAYAEEDRDESISKWRLVFGDDFAAGEVLERAGSVSKIALASYKEQWAATGITDLVDLVKKIGDKALPPIITRLPHMQRPRWRQARADVQTVNIHAQLGSSNGGDLREVKSLEPLQKGQTIRFVARNKIGYPFPAEYDIKWRISNTDKMASSLKKLRGEFYPSDDKHGGRKEELSYRGVHVVEAYLIRKADEMLVGKSAPFFVMIE